jgi:predicted nuclease of predicted toxin-antitoxin system
VIHTLDLPKGNRTSDISIAAIADEEGYIVVSKDSDFVISLLLKSTPRRLLQISTGNIPNPELEDLLSKISNQLSRRSIQVRISRSTGQT